jgi:Aspartyl protease
VRLIYAIQILFALSACRAAEGSTPLAEIPFQFRDGLIWIEVSVSDCRAPLHFLLDSGAQVSVINTGTAQRLGLKRGRPISVRGVGSTTTGFWPQALEARAGGIQLPRNYLMLDLSKLSAACTNSIVDGIIGADFFHDRIVQVDFQSQTVRLLCEPPAETGMQILPLKVRPCGMLVAVQINNSKAQWVRLDTGCASALQWVTSSVRLEGCTKRVAVALTSFSIPVTQTTLTVGTVRFERVPTDLQKEEVFPGEKGLLGNGVLSQFQTVTIDAKGKKVMLGQKPSRTSAIVTRG